MDSRCCFQFHCTPLPIAELGSAEKPTVTIFNKMDAFIKNTFDEWLEEDVKKELLNDLKQRWQNETKGSCVFISALEKQNIDLLRQTILNAVREMYQIRYPYRAEFFY